MWTLRWRGAPKKPSSRDFFAITWKKKVFSYEPFPLRGNITVQRLASVYGEFVLGPSDFVTSLVDFYGFKDKGEKTIEELKRNISDEVVREDSIGATWTREEFFLTSNDMSLKDSSSRMSRVLGPYRRLTKNAWKRLGQIRQQFETPEHINDNSTTAPSKRIEALILKYNKVLHGPLVAGETGLDSMRNECPRFNEWLSRLESLA